MMVETHWTQTWLGQAFDLLGPDSMTVDVHDIARSLAMLPRFTGHLDDHYSVAQHSVLVSEVVDPRWALEGLLHDAAEAYLNDVSAPVKRAMRALMAEMWDGVDIRRNAGIPGWAMRFRSPYDELERRARLAIAGRFGLAPEIPDLVVEADLRMLATEHRDLIGIEARPWRLPAEPYEIQISPWRAEDAEARFLDRFDRLLRLRGGR